MQIFQSKKGITLVETIVSVALFAIVMGSILQVAIQSVTAGRRSEYAYTAFNLAKNHIETLKSMPFSNLANANETDAYIDAADTPNLDGPFIRNTIITSNYTGDANLVQAQVSVDYLWKNSRSGNATQLTTVIFAYN